WRPWKNKRRWPAPLEKPGWKSGRTRSRDEDLSSPGAPGPGASSAPARRGPLRTSPGAPPPQDGRRLAYTLRRASAQKHTPLPGTRRDAVMHSEARGPNALVDAARFVFWSARIK